MNDVGSIFIKYVVCVILDRIESKNFEEFKVVIEVRILYKESLIYLFWCLYIS